MLTSSTKFRAGWMNGYHQEATPHMEMLWTHWRHGEGSKDACGFELRCWRRLWRVPWRLQSIKLQEIMPSPKLPGFKNCSTKKVNSSGTFRVCLKSHFLNNIYFSQRFSRRWPCLFLQCGGYSRVRLRNVFRIRQKSCLQSPGILLFLLLAL